MGFGKSFERELGKNTAKWLSNKVFGDGHATPIRVVNERQTREKEILKRNQQEKQRAQRDRIREKERIQREKLQLLNDQRELREMEKAQKQQEKEDKLQAENERKEDNRRQVAEFEDYIQTITTFHQRHSNEFNWSNLLAPPNILEAMDKAVSLIRSCEDYATLEELRANNYCIYNAFTGRKNVIRFLSAFANRDGIDPTEVLQNLSDEHSLMNLNSAQSTWYFDEFEWDISLVKERFTQAIAKLKPMQDELAELDQNEKIQQIELENISWISGVISRKKAAIIEQQKQVMAQKERVNAEIIRTKKELRYDDLCTIIDEYNCAVETIPTLEAAWKQVANDFHWSKEIHLIANKIMHNPQSEDFDRAERIFDPFDFADDLDISIATGYHTSIHEVDVTINAKDVVPKESLTLIRGNEVKIKEYSKKEFFEIFQDHICSLCLRIGKEYFNFFTMRSDLIMNVYTNIINDATGLEENCRILSVKLNKEQLDDVNMSYIDPSSCLHRFEHFARFSQTLGYQPIVETFETSPVAAVKSVAAQTGSLTPKSLGVILRSLHSRTDADKLKWELRNQLDNQHEMEEETYDDQVRDFIELACSVGLLVAEGEFYRVKKD